MNKGPHDITKVPDEVTVEVSLVRYAAETSVCDKSITFVCSVKEAERVFRAACEAAAGEKANGQKEDL